MKNILKPIQYIQNLWVKVGKESTLEARKTIKGTTIFNVKANDKLISQDLTSKFVYELLETLNHFSVKASKETKNLSRLGKMSYFCNEINGKTSSPKEFKIEMKKIGFNVEIK